MRTLLVIAASAMLMIAPSAMAHSGAVATTPAATSVVRALPATITITFGGRLLRVVGVSVTDSRGRDHASSARLDPRNAARVLVRTTRPARGAYTVRWRVQSEDGHPASGTFAFRVRP